MVTANISPHPLQDKQKIDIQIVDGSNHKNIYMYKRNVKGETRLAITTHENADVGVCFSNTLDSSLSLIPSIASLTN